MSISPEAMDANLVLTLDEITSLTQDGGKPADTLMNVVALIASRFRTDVCSAYLLEPDRAKLVHSATLGLRRECIGSLRMAVHEGLTGPSPHGFGGSGSKTNITCAAEPSKDCPSDKGPVSHLANINGLIL